MKISSCSFDEKMELLKQLGAATVYEAQGAIGALDNKIKPIDSGMLIAGSAFTVDMKPSDNLMIHSAMLKVSQGDVLVIDCKGFIEAGPWGDVLTNQAIAVGVRGLVINGAVRDSKEIVRLNFPVFSLGLSIKGTTKIQGGSLNVPLNFSGVTINPGDIILGDRDGVVVIDKERLDEVILLSLEREKKESEYIEKIKIGKKTIDLLGIKDN